MHILFLDESGDHDLVNVDKQYPIFVLAGCIMTDKHHDAILRSEIDKLRINSFGNKGVILHYADYTRNKNGFERMVEKPFRDNFYNELNEIIKNTDFSLVACIIDKIEHIKHYKYPTNPYLFSLEVIIEKFVMFLNEVNDNGIIIAESRDPQLDNELNLAFLDIKIRGTRFLKASEIIKKIGNSFYIKKKEENIAGLQLVDTLVTPVGRKYLGLKNVNINYDIIKGKFRKHPCGRYRGYGLVILPRK